MSIPSNIAEGHSRTTGNFLNHLDIAVCSEAEIETPSELAYRLGMVAKSRVDVLLDDAAEVARMLNGLIASVEKSRKQNCED